MKEELRKGGTPRAGWGEELINLKRERLTHKSLRAFQNIIGPLDIPHPTESIIHAVCSLMIHPQTICTSLNFFFQKHSISLLRRRPPDSATRNFISYNPLFLISFLSPTSICQSLIFPITFHRHLYRLQSPWNRGKLQASY